MPRSDDYDVATSCVVADLDMDGQHEILLGTYGQELLMYKLIEKPVELKTEDSSPVEAVLRKEWELMWTRSFNAPILALQHLDLTGHGLKELILMTTRSVQVLQHDLEEVKAILRSRLKKMQSSELIQSRIANME